MQGFASPKCDSALVVSIAADYKTVQLRTVKTVTEFIRFLVDKMAVHSEHRAIERRSVDAMSAFCVWCAVFCTRARGLCVGIVLRDDAEFNL